MRKGHQNMSWERGYTRAHDNSLCAMIKGTKLKNPHLFSHFLLASKFWIIFIKSSMGEVNIEQNKLEYLDTVIEHQKRDS